MTEKQKPVYLGDSVYLDTFSDEGHAILFTFNGIDKDNIIYLDPMVAGMLAGELIKHFAVEESKRNKS